MNVRNITNNLSHWFHSRQQRALEEAYTGAQKIAELEAEYFDSGKIAYTPNQSKIVYDYVRSLRDHQLIRIRFNLVQFGVNNFLFDRQASVPNEVNLEETDRKTDRVRQKLDFIESVIAKYREDDGIKAALLDRDAGISDTEILNRTSGAPKDLDTTARTIDPAMIEASSESTQVKKSRSLFERLKPFRNQNEEAEYERQALVNLRLHRQHNRIAMRWLVLVLLIPLAVQILSKNLIFEPILGNYSSQNPERIELSQEIRNRFAREFSLVKERLEVESLLKITPELSEKAKKEKLEEAALDIWRESRNEELNGLKNLLADGVALIVFAGIAYVGRSKIAILRSTTNRSFLKLADPVKVFLFILITDMFVGFHSAEGWEVLLDVIAEHFGIPANEALVKGFIATVPVIIDSCIKFWIFNYLTRYSPSSSAIYERMNT